MRAPTYVMACATTELNEGEVVVANAGAAAASRPILTRPLIAQRHNRPHDMLRYLLEPFMLSHPFTRRWIPRQRHGRSPAMVTTDRRSWARKGFIYIYPRQVLPAQPRTATVHMGNGRVRVSDYPWMVATLAPHDTRYFPFGVTNENPPCT